ncbi:hypothetical protein BCR39DRAFT_79135 [Naematelia encephala]|uniref:Uncharacterized protein n=1 Tax=Naematelia encephala TaxID=71784 RepID=A0A1Y2BB48_9TREE|nr:hypothetical protein BCR39DRAFT_79135 [Naematelia encephala]
MSRALSDGQVVEAILYLVDEDPRPNLLFGAPAFSISQIANQLSVPIHSLNPNQLCDVIRPLCDSLFATPRVPCIRTRERGGQIRHWLVFEDFTLDKPSNYPRPQARPAAGMMLGGERRLREDVANFREKRRNRSATIVQDSPSTARFDQWHSTDPKQRDDQALQYRGAVEIEESTFDLVDMYQDGFDEAEGGKIGRGPEGEESGPRVVRFQDEIIEFSRKHPNSMTKEKPSNERPATLWEMGSLIPESTEQQYHTSQPLDITLSIPFDENDESMRSTGMEPTPLKNTVTINQPLSDSRLSPSAALSGISSLSVNENDVIHSQVDATAVVLEGASEERHHQPPTPWVTKTFADLPFGPEIAVGSSIDMISRQWQVLVAQLVVVLGLTYLIQVSGL